MLGAESLSFEQIFRALVSPVDAIIDVEGHSGGVMKTRSMPAFLLYSTAKKSAIC
jgi:hypothetical protein